MSSEHKNPEVQVSDEKPPKSSHSSEHDCGKKHAAPSAVTPPHARKFPFKIPSPVPTRRTRTTSQSRIASESPEETGICKSFCRNRGHGFITPHDGGKDIFVHISDIEGEFVLKEGDAVTYRTCPLPPKNTEKQAVMVIIKELNGPHEKWWNNTQ